MSFLSRKDVLTFDEMLRLCRIFMQRGIDTFRITGGEPLIRRGIGEFIEQLGSYKNASSSISFKRLTLTTNGTLLSEYANLLKRSGVNKVNVSLDTLDPARYHDITRGGDIERAKKGILAARNEGLNVRINMVALRGVNDGEFDNMLRLCGEIDADLCIIEIMPMGAMDKERLERFLPLTEVKEQLSHRWTFVSDRLKTAGPARYIYVAETKTHLGFISPLTENFCADCNRVRLSCNGKLYTCLGQHDHVSLGQLIRENATDDDINRKIDEAIAAKPAGHDFVVDQQMNKVSNTSRYMNMTGG